MTGSPGSRTSRSRSSPERGDRQGQRRGGANGVDVEARGALAELGAQVRRELRGLRGVVETSVQLD